MWLSRAGTCSTEYFVLIRFKYLTTISAFWGEIYKNKFDAQSMNNTVLYSMYLLLILRLLLKCENINGTFYSKYHFY
jgi:hypothetical protein